MAKPLSDKSRIIRETIGANPDMGNAQLAELINSADDRQDDKIRVTAAEINNQKQILKKAARTATKKGRPAKTPKAAAPEAPAAPAAKQAGGPVELIDRLFDLAGDAGGMEKLKRLVDRLHEIA